MTNDGKLARVEGNALHGYDVVSGICGARVVLRGSWEFLDGAQGYADKLNAVADAWFKDKARPLVGALEKISQGFTDEAGTEIAMKALEDFK